MHQFRRFCTNLHYFISDEGHASESAVLLYFLCFASHYTVALELSNQIPFRWHAPTGNGYSVLWATLELVQVTPFRIVYSATLHFQHNLLCSTNLLLQAVRCTNRHPQLPTSQVCSLLPTALVLPRGLYLNFRHKLQGLCSHLVWAT